MLSKVDLRKLEQILDSFNQKILFVGIGNVLKSDDGVGVYISERIKTTFKKSALTVEISIENYIGKINALNPDLLVLIDCMEMNQPPGYFRILDVNNISDTTSNTHNISLKQLGKFFNMPVFVLGIQPQYIDFGEILSDAVRKSADSILDLINTAI